MVCSIQQAPAFFRFVLRVLVFSGEIVASLLPVCSRAGEKNGDGAASAHRAASSLDKPPLCFRIVLAVPGVVTAARVPDGALLFSLSQSLSVRAFLVVAFSAGRLRSRDGMYTFVESMGIGTSRMDSGSNAMQ